MMDMALLYLGAGAAFAVALREMDHHRNAHFSLWTYAFFALTWPVASALFAFLQLRGQHAVSFREDAE